MSKSLQTPVMRSPLHRYDLTNRAKKLDASCGVWANEIPLLGYISLRGNAQQADFLNAVKSALGVDLPTQACTSQALSHQSAILWLSPDEWLIYCKREQCEQLQTQLRKTLLNIHSQVVDNSGAYTTVILQGENSSDVLQHCTVYDLQNLSENKVVGTTFGKMSLYLQRKGKTYQLVLRRSFADYIWILLERSAEPYGFGVQSIAT